MSAPIPVSAPACLHATQARIVHVRLCVLGVCVCVCVSVNVFSKLGSNVFQCPCACFPACA